MKFTRLPLLGVAAKLFGQPIGSHREASLQQDRFPAGFLKPKTIGVIQYPKQHADVVPHILAKIFQHGVKPFTGESCQEFLAYNILQENLYRKFAHQFINRSTYSMRREVAVPVGKQIPNTLIPDWESYCGGQ